MFIFVWFLKLGCTVARRGGPRACRGRRGSVADQPGPVHPHQTPLYNQGYMYIYIHIGGVVLLINQVQATPTKLLSTIRGIYIYIFIAKLQPKMNNCTVVGFNYSTWFHLQTNFEIMIFIFVDANSVCIVVNFDNCTKLTFFFSKYKYNMHASLSPEIPPAPLHSSLSKDLEIFWIE